MESLVLPSESGYWLMVFDTECYNTTRQVFSIMATLAKARKRKATGATVLMHHARQLPKEEAMMTVLPSLSGNMGWLFVFPAARTLIQH
jgi:hypothetical protein